jgi:formylglycine-generating enzyme required for sulfatase activity
VDSVSWDDVQDYLSKLNQLSGKQYRLPTEQEWKHACDGGGSQEYCGSNSLATVGWHDGNSGNKTHLVGQKRANGYGLYDMTGNVWEWTQDCGKGGCSERVLRGGAWSFNPVSPPAPGRRLTPTTMWSSDIGFRVVVRSATPRRAQ